MKTKAQNLLSVLDKLTSINDNENINEWVALYTFVSNIHFDFIGKGKNGIKYNFRDLDVFDALSMDSRLIAHTKDFFRAVEQDALYEVNRYCQLNDLPDCVFVSFKLEPRGLVTTVSFKRKLSETELKKIQELLANELKNGFGLEFSDEVVYTFDNILDVNDLDLNPLDAVLDEARKNKHNVPITFSVYIYPWFDSKEDKWSIKQVAR